MTEATLAIASPPITQTLPTSPSWATELRLRRPRMIIPEQISMPISTPHFNQAMIWLPKFSNPGGGAGGGLGTGIASSTSNSDMALPHWLAAADGGFDRDPCTTTRPGRCCPGVPVSRDGPEAWGAGWLVTPVAAGALEGPSSTESTTVPVAAAP